MSDFFENLMQEVKTSTEPLAGLPEASQGLRAPSVLSDPATPVTEGIEWETSVTPSGVEVRFCKDPRKYEVRNVLDEWTTDGTDWTEVPSVTQILDTLSKPALVWWGMKVGVEGVKELLDDYYTDTNGKQYPLESVELAVEMLTANKLTVNHVRDKAAYRGSSVHEALEHWYRAQVSDNPKVDPNVLLQPDFYPEEEKGYIQALVNFLDDAGLEPIASEVMVGSVEHGFAGRYDLLAYYGGNEICTHLTPKIERRDTLEPGVFLIDLKTSKGVYPQSHYRQLAAYEQASVECGYEPSDNQIVVNCQSDGRYQAKVSCATLEDFLAVKSVYDSNQRLK